MVNDLTRNPISEGETRRYHPKAINTSLQQSELLIKPQVRVNDLFKKLKVSLPGTNSIQSSESESRGGEISRKRRRDEGASPSSASNPSICLNTEPKKTDPVQVGEKNRSDAQLRRSSRIFEPPKPLNGQRPLDLFGLYAQKLARIPGPPITLERNIDASKLDFNFEFINTYKMQEGVEQVDPNFHAGCDCQGPKCDLSACACLSLEDDSDERIVPYQVGNHGVIVLREDFMRRKPQMIYECSMLCGCGPSCMNRVVEKGRTVSLEIFDTKGRGFGLRSKNHIQAGQFIDCYLGEVLTKKMTNDRESAVISGQASYFFSLDFFVDDNDSYVVDGRQFGSITRFMNHSCNPNCKMFSVSHNHADQRIFSMGFFAREDIPAGKELTFDYDPNWKANHDSTKSDPDAVRCLCGEDNCRGLVWASQRKTMQ